MWWWGSIMAIFRPQVVVHRTSKSPSQLLFSCAFRTLLIIAVGVIGAWLAYQYYAG
jgi:hypothetical protein